MAGMTSTNKRVVTTKADLVSQFVVDTAKKTMEVEQSASGGTLLVDECYQLVTRRNDFGKEAIETIMSVMDGPRRNVITTKHNIGRI